MKVELKKRVSSSDQLGEYSPVPVSTHDNEFGLTDHESEGGSSVGLSSGDLEMGQMLSGLPRGGLPPSLEWDE